jgi:hypothetical protein
VVRRRRLWSLAQVRATRGDREGAALEAFTRAGEAPVNRFQPDAMKGAAP